MFHAALLKYCLFLLPFGRPRFLFVVVAAEVLVRLRVTPRERGCLRGKYATAIKPEVYEGCKVIVHKAWEVGIIIEICIIIGGGLSV